MPSFSQILTNAKIATNYIYTILGMGFLWMGATTLFSQPYENLHVSEFMASNDQFLADEDGDFPDWIELHNPTAQAIELEGWFISDKTKNILKWDFPQVSISPGGYLLIFASGKDRKNGELHTNFQLSSSGENIVLTSPDGITTVFVLEDFPVQLPDISYGPFEGEWIYMDVPSPGQANVEGSILSPPSFSVQRGFFEEQFQLNLQSASEDAQIVYTLDGSQPSATNGITYSRPLNISQTTTIRAASIKTSYPPSRTETHSYIFPASVLQQSNDPEGYPDNWGSFSTIEGLAPADYEMDPEITEDPSYRDQLIPALLSIPSVSITTHKDFLFSLRPDPDSGGIYVYTNPPTGDGFGEDWERPVSFEYLSDDGRSTQVDCGIRIQGGHSRVPEKNPKHSFRLVFRGEYGPKRFNFDVFGGDATQSFNTLILRSGFNQTWVHWTGSQRKMAQYINDSWVKDTHQKMGHLAAHNRFVHLYLNGMYWGMYNLSERMDKDFMDFYLPGEEDDFDIIKDFAELADGNKQAWDEMMDMATDSTTFFKIQGQQFGGMMDSSLVPYVDIHNLIDYMILNFYIGNKDWDHHNWVAVRNREKPGNGFQFIPWDSERSFGSLRDNVVEENNSNRPSFLYSQYRNDFHFRRLFSERARELLGPSGPLGPEAAAQGWRERSAEIELAIIAESARWGDYRRDVHPYRNGDFDLYTKNKHWEDEQKYLYEDYFPFRSDTVYQQLFRIGVAEDPVDRLGEHASFPNPFSRSTTLFYRLNTTSQVKVQIISLEGKLLETLFEGAQDQGDHFLRWEPKGMAEGLYIYNIQIGSNAWFGKLIHTR